MSSKIPQVHGTNDRTSSATVKPPKNELAFDHACKETSSVVSFSAIKIGFAFFGRPKDGEWEIEGVFVKTGKDRALLLAVLTEGGKLHQLVGEIWKFKNADEVRPMDITYQLDVPKRNAKPASAKTKLKPKRVRVGVLSKVFAKSEQAAWPWPTAESVAEKARQERDSKRAAWPFPTNRTKPYP